MSTPIRTSVPAAVPGHDCSLPPCTPVSSHTLVEAPVRKPSGVRHTTAPGIRRTGPRDHNQVALQLERLGGIGNGYDDL